MENESFLSFVDFMSDWFQTTAVCYWMYQLLTVNGCCHESKICLSLHGLSHTACRFVSLQHPFRQAAFYHGSCFDGQPMFGNCDVTSFSEIKSNSNPFWRHSLILADAMSCVFFSCIVSVIPNLKYNSLSMTTLFRRLRQKIS